MSNINVTYDEMNTAATTLVTGKEELSTKLTELRTFIDNLVGSGFVTEQASGAFQETYTNFTTNATETVAALDGLSSYLTNAADTLRSTDEALAAQARG